MFISTRKIFSFTGCSRNSKKLWSNALIGHFASSNGAVKWHPCNFEPKLPWLSNNLVWNSPVSMQM